MIAARAAIRRSGNFRLGGLGTVDAGSQLVNGVTYMFYFVQGGVLPLDPSAVAVAVAKDVNFKNPTADIQTTGLFQANKVRVVFQYNGKGSNAIQAGQEMAKVINDNVWKGSVSFDSADRVDANSSTISNQPPQTPSFQWPSAQSIPWGVVLAGVSVVLGGAVLVKAFK